MTSPDSIAIDRIESARFLFSDHETARRFLEAPKDSHPGIAAEALRRGERYYTGHIDARLRARGAEPSPREMQDREVYAFFVERARADGDYMPRNGAVVDTARPQDEVAAEILALTLRALEGVAP